MSESKTENIATDIVRRLAREICRHPEDLEVWEIKSGPGVEINIRSHQGDKARLIGFKGQNFRALQKIGTEIGHKHRYVITMPGVLESIVGTPDRYPKFEVRNEWPKERFEALLEDTASALFRGPSATAMEDHEEGATTATIQVWKEEAPQLVHAALEALNVLFNAAGRNQGRIITVRIATGDKFDLTQPRSAAGRHATEVRR